VSESPLTQLREMARQARGKTMEEAVRCLLQFESTRGRSQLAAGNQNLLGRLNQVQTQLPKSPQ
jgi:hypothetical protein